MAERLGMTVRQYLSSHTSPEIVDSLAYDRIAVPEEWQRHAALMHHIEALVTGPEKARPYESFLPPRYRPKPKPMTSAEIKSRIRAASRSR